MYGFVITTAGEAMLARAAAGEALVLDAVMVGRGVVESAAAAKALNTLIDPVAAATSTAPAVSGNQISMTVEYRNDLNGGLEAGFALSEFGISAHVGDDPAALLYYGSLGDAPQPVKPASEGLDVHRFPVAIAVTGEVSVTLEYPAGGFLTEEDLGGLNYIPTSEKGKPGGVATLDSDGKVSEEQLPEMNYDPAGSAEAVQENLDVHTTDKANPHGVTAEQVPYDNSRTELASETAQGAIDELFARMYGDLKVQVQVYETGTTTPISGVIVTGIASETGGVCYANSNGIATGYVLSDEQSATVTVKVGTDYIDLTGQTSQQVTVTKGVTAHATIYATRVSNPSGKTEVFTVSAQRMFTDKVKRVDVHAVGGGAGGSTGNVYSSGDGSSFGARGGRGGQAGASKFSNDVSFTPNKLYTITVGAAGTGAKSVSSERSAAGTKGGTSSAISVSATGGAANAGGIAGDIYRYGYTDITEATSGNSSEVRLFGEALLSIAGGGDGGGGGAYMSSGGYRTPNAAGGTPNGGSGGYASYNTADDGTDATGIGGGGGGGGTSHGGSPTTNKAGNAGNGYRGQVWIRWWY